MYIYQNLFDFQGLLKKCKTFSLFSTLFDYKFKKNCK